MVYNISYCFYILAIHEQHGLAWTDGQGIFLTPVSLFQGKIENQEHNKLGEFT